MVLTKSHAYANLNTSFKKHKNISKKHFRAVQEKEQGSSSIVTLTIQKAHNRALTIASTESLAR